METYKIGDKVFYNGKLGVVKSLNNLELPNNVGFQRGSISGVLGDVFKMNDYELVEDNDTLVTGDTVVLLELYYPLQQLNEGILANYRKLVFNKETTISVNETSYTLGGMIVNKDHKAIFAIPFKTYKLTNDMIQVLNDNGYTVI